jgi:superfamily I DNA/RNA helicase
VTVLNKESAKGQEFDSVFILELEELLPCPDGAPRRVMYMLCARARDYLWLVHAGGTLTLDQEACLPPDRVTRVT